MKQKLTKRQKDDLEKYENMAEYYERKDFSGEWEESAANGSLIVNKVTTPVKRVNMNISEDLYKMALDIDSTLSMGYQNVLKAALLLGLTELQKRRSLSP